MEAYTFFLHNLQNAFKYSISDVPGCIAPIYFNIHKYEFYFHYEKHKTEMIYLSKLFCFSKNLIFHLYVYFPKYTSHIYLVTVIYEIVVKTIISKKIKNKLD